MPEEIWIARKIEEVKVKIDDDKAELAMLRRVRRKLEELRKRDGA